VSGFKRSVVAQAAKQAKALGLKGKDLAAKVQEAVKARKAQMAEARGKAKEAKAIQKKQNKSR